MEFKERPTRRIRPLAVRFGLLLDHFLSDFFGNHAAKASSTAGSSSSVFHCFPMSSNVNVFLCPSRIFFRTSSLKEVDST